MPHKPSPTLEEQAKEIWRSLAFHGSHERGGPLLAALNGLDPQLFWAVFYQNWQTCDAVAHLGREFEALLIQANKQARFKGHCSPEAADWFDKLPDPISVYRGGSILSLRSLSWTTDRDVAAGFARGHRGINVYMPVIGKALISKRSVLAAFATEREIVLRPRLLRNMAMEVLFTPDNPFSDPRPKAEDLN